MLKIKQCNKCGTVKSINEFSKDKNSKDGFCYQCKECYKHYCQRPDVKRRAKEYFQEYNKRPEVKEKAKKRTKEYSKEYYKRPEIKERIKKRSKEYYKNNGQKPEVKERKKEYNKEYLQKPEVKEKRKKYHREYLQRPEVKKRRKKWNKEYGKVYFQKIEVKERMKEYYRNRRLTDPQFKLSNNISRAIRLSLNGNKAGRHWEDLVGYTLRELKFHLEKQFDLFMSWENQGSYWHIDHVKPISWFKFTQPEDEEFKECWELKNLQPMEKIENIIKGNRISYKTIKQYE